MEIKKVKGGWEYDGLVFVKEKDAIGCKEDSESGESDLDWLPLNPNPRIIAYILCDHPGCEGVTKDHELQGWYMLRWREVELWFCPNHHPLKGDDLDAYIPKICPLCAENERSEDEDGDDEDEHSEEDDEN